MEYRWYFPPDFDASAFLAGRRYSFAGAYRAAFYTHIISGPLAIALGAISMISGGQIRFRRLHRYVGKLQILMVILLIFPSGLIMAMQATAGPIARWGFASLSMVTAVSALVVVQKALAGDFQSHRRWATRCFVLLCSPLLLRLISGALIVTGLESDFYYRLNAWVSWMIPLAIYEWSWRIKAVEAFSFSRGAVCRVIEEAVS